MSVLILEAFAGKDGILTKNQVHLRKIFGEQDMMAEIEGKLINAGFNAELTGDAGTDCSRSTSVIQTAKASRSIGISQAMSNFKKAIELKRTLDTDFPGPFILGENGSSETLATREELLER
ncbi:MAG: hypothetical protein IPK98_16995 [Chloracidobacterium sp.]|nr:hypothetical protein [Chloracidobacterium sp.]